MGGNLAGSCDEGGRWEMRDGREKREESSGGTIARTSKSGELRSIAL